MYISEHFKPTKRQCLVVVLPQTTNTLYQPVVTEISMSGMLSLVMEKPCSVFQNVTTLASHAVTFLRRMDLAVSTIL